MSRDTGINIKCRAILHDPDVYPNPHEPVPERYTEGQKGALQGEESENDQNPDPRSFAFGYGRR